MEGNFNARAKKNIRKEIKTVIQNKEKIIQLKLTEKHG